MGTRVQITGHRHHHRPESAAIVRRGNRGSCATGQENLHLLLGRETYAGHREVRAARDGIRGCREHWSGSVRYDVEHLDPEQAARTSLDEDMMNADAHVSPDNCV